MSASYPSTDHGASAFEFGTLGIVEGGRGRRAWKEERYGKREGTRYGKRS